jgi:DNA-binding transcriptional LysR family regulator
MELRQLEYFVTVAEEANFTRAAAKLHVAQPGVSAQIRQLEREFGHALLDRSGRGVRLTEVGAAVLPFARAALGAVDGAKLVVDQLDGLLRGKVAIGMVTNCPAADLTEALAAFHKAHPAVEITLSEDNSDRLLDLLRNGRLDLALVGLATPPAPAGAGFAEAKPANLAPPAPAGAGFAEAKPANLALPPSGIATQVITDQALVAAVAHGHALTARTSITLAALRDHPLISLPVGTGLRASLDNACAAAGLRPRIAFEASDPRVLGQLASRGLGVAILPEVGARQDPDLHVLAIVKPRLRARLELAWRSSGPLGPAARVLIEEVRHRL